MMDFKWVTMSLDAANQHLPFTTGGSAHWEAIPEPEGNLLSHFEEGKLEAKISLDFHRQVSPHEESSI